MLETSNGMAFVGIASAKAKLVTILFGTMERANEAPLCLTRETLPGKINSKQQSKKEAHLPSIFFLKGTYCLWH
jgi:hypothetical protein